MNVREMDDKLNHLLSKGVADGLLPARSFGWDMRPALAAGH